MKEAEIRERAAQPLPVLLQMRFPDHCRAVRPPTSRHAFTWQIATVARPRHGKRSVPLHGTQWNEVLNSTPRKCLALPNPDRGIRRQSRCRA